MEEDPISHLGLSPNVSAKPWKYDRPGPNAWDEARDTVFHYVFFLGGCPKKNP
jgi:hypothetical protein